ncbi:MAG TPA: hypothetical protein VNI57_01440 [Candidatus Saccharimonadales bacterium]|nr:hypothetical protein [Candidatus Saccharimonadales bacterium]
MAQGNPNSGAGEPGGAGGAQPPTLSPAELEKKAQVEREELAAKELLAAKEKQTDRESAYAALVKLAKDYSWAFPVETRQQVEELIRRNDTRLILEYLKDHAWALPPKLQVEAQGLFHRADLKPVERKNAGPGAAWSVLGPGSY